MPATRPLATALAPVPASSQAKIGKIEVRSLVNGRVTGLDLRYARRQLRGQDSGGCQWTRQYGWFAPSDRYDGCGTSKDWQSASGKVRRLDDIFPLKLGATGHYARRAVSATGKVSERETHCRVTETVAVIRAGLPDAPAYVVVCDDGRIERTTWYSPELGPVAYRESHKKRGLREAWIRI